MPVSPRALALIYSLLEHCNEGVYVLPDGQLCALRGYTGRC